MKLFRVLLVLALASLFGACGQDSADQSCDQTGNDRAFGVCCTDNSQCASGVCHQFGDGTQACTVTCSSNADCPDGSQGKKCNGKGVCRT